MTAPFFSIVVPVYNRADFVGTMIRSALEQTFSNFELIIIDDGSTDNTQEAVASFQDPRISYQKITNSERAVARNTGAARATGTYLNFFDSDDVMHANHLQVARDFILENNSPRWFHVGFDIRDEHGKLLVRETGTRHKPEQRLIDTNYLGCNSVFIQRDLFLEHQFNENRVLASSEDWELWLRVISREQLHTCSEVTFTMTHHANRSLLTISPDRVISRDTVMLHGLLNDKSFTAKFQSQVLLFEADRYTFFALTLLVAGRRKEAVDYLRKSLSVTWKVLCRKRFWACGKLILVSFVK